MRHDLFSTPLWHIEGTPQQLVDELYQGAYRIKEKYPSETKSNEGGYQTPTFDWKSFHPQGIEYVDKVIGNIFPFQVESWWYNINGKGHWNLPHTHPSSDFALVWYLTDSDSLLQLISPFPQRRIENHCGGHINVDAKKGDIVMFPSDINHYVMPNQRDTDRVSISMNLQLC
jgi:hypothetical protein